jgi:hypothetical protein
VRRRMMMKKGKMRLWIRFRNPAMEPSEAQKRTQRRRDLREEARMQTVLMLNATSNERRSARRWEVLQLEWTATAAPPVHQLAAPPVDRKPKA